MNDDKNIDQAVDLSGIDIEANNQDSDLGYQLTNSDENQYSIWNRIKYSIFEAPKRLAFALVMFCGLLQLAFVNIHISAIVTVLPNEAPGSHHLISSSGIGMFMFFFILMGLVAIFAATRVVDFASTIFAIVTNVVVIAFGGWFQLQMLTNGAARGAELRLNSLIFAAIGILIYIAAIVVYCLQLVKYRKQRGTNNEV